MTATCGHVAVAVRVLVRVLVAVRVLVRVLVRRGRRRGVLDGITAPPPPPPVATLVGRVVPPTGRTDLDLDAGQFGRRRDHESTDVITDVEHDHALTGVRVLRRRH
jgi:hypothetical protein